MDNVNINDILSSLSNAIRTAGPAVTAAAN